MKEYINTTQNFNNETREWEGREEEGNDKYGIWKFDNEFSKLIDSLNAKYSFGVHALNRNWWMTLPQIVEETIKMYYGGAVCHLMERDFREFVKSTPEYKSIIEQDILKELEFLITLDMVRVREKK